MTRWICDGVRVEAISPDERAWQYGDGLFETVAVRNGSPRLIDWHIERLSTGCRRLGIEVPATLPDTVSAAVADDGSASAFGVLKIVVTAGASPRGYRRVSGASAAYARITASEPLPPVHYAEGVDVRTCNTRLARQPQLAGMKTLNRLEQVLARAEWSGDEVFEGLTFDTDDALICGTMSNVFIVDDNTLLTPDLSQSGIAGIMRRKVIESAAALNVAVNVKTIRQPQLGNVEELFICNSQFGVLPVATLDGRRCRPGKVTRRLMQALVDDGFAEMAC